MAQEGHEGGSPGAALPSGGSHAVAPAPRPPAAKPRAGWYPDPWARGHHRYWDGEAWTAHAFPNGPVTLRADQARSADGAPAPTPTGPPTTRSIAAPPPPEWWPPDGRGVGPVFPPPEEPPAPSAEAARRWRLPEGRALVAMVVAAGLIIGFTSVGIFYALTGESKPATPAAAPFVPQLPTTTTVPAATPGTTPGTTPGATPSTTPGATPGGAALAPSDPSASVLSGLVVTQSDVASTETVRPLPGGSEVTGQPTLDLCNASFPSESLRTARLQVAAIDDQGNGVLSTEAVLYSNPAATAQGFAELKQAAARCPSGPVVSPVGEPTTATRFNPAPDGAWPAVPGVERLAYDFVTTDDSGQTQHSVAVYLRRGRVLMGVYFPRPDGAQPAVRGQTSMAGIVNLFATRMAQLSTAVVNGG